MKAAQLRALQGRIKDLQSALDALSKDVAALEQSEPKPAPKRCEHCGQPCDKRYQMAVRGLEGYELAFVCIGCHDTLHPTDVPWPEGAEACMRCDNEPREEDLGSPYCATCNALIAEVLRQVIDTRRAQDIAAAAPTEAERRAAWTAALDSLSKPVPERCWKCKGSGVLRYFLGTVDICDECSSSNAVPPRCEPPAEHPDYCFACDDRGTIVRPADVDGIGWHIDGWRRLWCYACNGGLTPPVRNPLTPHQPCSAAGAQRCPVMQCPRPARQSLWFDRSTPAQCCAREWLGFMWCTFRLHLYAGARPMEIPPPRPHSPEPGLCSPGLAGNGCVDATGNPIKPMGLS